MADRFDKFTERARRVMGFAQDEAQRLNHNYIGTEHVVLGLVRETEGVAAQALAGMGVEPNKVRTAVEFIIGRGDRMVTGEIGLTPRAKRVIELAADEARRLDHQYVGTEHLLIGLVREGEGIAAGVLRSLGVDVDQARDGVVAVLRGAAPRRAPAPGPRPADAAAPAGPGAGDRFDAFTDRAKRVLTLAQAEAVRLDHNYIGTEHLLLGLVGEEEGAAAQALRAVGVDLELARGAVERIVGRGDRLVGGEIGVTPRAKRAIELSVKEAGRRQDAAIDTGHLLLGMLAEGEGVAIGVLESLGAGPDAVRAAVEARMRPAA
ncbi:MAG TPA: Clp protease N-terminal domain-containing protein [Chloroflexota bacterium]|jgi:ATP-dependent Clp protease ATP-binding subunit ClpA|nr:Clp protease N-terminal domain-containing protein [Chloroflexota bacterium]